MDDTARVEKYAKWLVQNKDKKGSPEFDKVAKAYKLLRSGGPSEVDTRPTPSWSEVPVEGAKTAVKEFFPAIGEAIAGTAEGVAALARDPVGTTNAMTKGAKGLLLNVPGMEALNEWGDTHGFPISPELRKYNEEAKSGGSETIAKKKEEYLTSEGLRRKIAYDPYGIVSDVATVGGPLAARKGLEFAGKVAKRSAAKVKAFNKAAVMYPEVSGDVAADIKRLKDSGEHDLMNVSTEERGATGAMSKLFTDNKTEMDINLAAVKHLLDPKAPDLSDAEKALRVKAAKALKSKDHIVRDHSLRDQIKAVEDLVGHTSEGARLVKGLKKQVEITRLRSNVQGGISKYTDVLNPLAVSGGLLRGTRGLPAMALTASHLINPMGMTAAAAQGGIVLGGRVIDAITGSRSIPNKYMKQNLGKKAIDPGEGLPSEAKRMLDEKAKARALAEEIVKQKEAAKVSEKRLADYHKKQAKKVDEIAAEQKAAAKVSAKRLADYHKKQAKKVDEIAAEQKAAAKVSAKRLADYHKAQAAKVDEIARRQLKEAKVKKSAEDKALKEADRAAKAKAKAEREANAPKDQYGNVIRNEDNYKKGEVEITEMEKTALSVASRAKTKQVKKAIELAVKRMQSIDGRGPKYQANRITFYYEAVAQGKTKAQKAAIKKALKPLVEKYMPGMDKK